MSYLDDNAREVIRPIKRMVEDEFLARPGVIGVDIGEKYTDGRPTGRAAIVVYVCAKGPDHPQQIPVGGRRRADGRGRGDDPAAPRQARPRRRTASPKAAWPNDIRCCAAASASARRGRSGSCRRRSQVAGEYVIAGTLGAFVVTRNEPESPGAHHVPRRLRRRLVVGRRRVRASVQSGRWDRRRRHGGGAGPCGTGRFGERGGPADGRAAVPCRGARHRRADRDRAGRDRLDGAQVRPHNGSDPRDGHVVDATLRLDFGDGIGVRTLRDQIRVYSAERFGDHGDSGAVLVDADNRVVGLYVAGSGSTGFANPIEPVLRQLDAELLTPGVPESRKPEPAA